MKDSKLKKIDLLQVYRGLAAILVLFFHGSEIIAGQFNQQNLFFNIGEVGWVGVDFFFVLSGFIIYYVHKNDIGHPSRLKSYSLKRFIRIYPLYWTVLFCKIGALAFINYRGGIRDLTFSSFIKNVLLYPQKERVINVSWTLSYEVFFYIIFGVLIALGYKRFFPLFGVWIIGIFVNSIGLIGEVQDIPLFNLIFNKINLEFLIGCLVAYLISNQKINVKQGVFLNYLATFLLTFLLTLCLVAYQTQIIDVDTSKEMGIIWALAFALLIIGSATVELNKSIKTHQSLVCLGDASYSIYLMHGFFVNNIAKIISQLNASLMTSNVLIIHTIALIIFLLTIGLGYLVYSYIEKPLITVLRAKLIPRRLT